MFRRPRGYHTERDVYLRFRKKALYRLQGFFIPILLDFDDTAMVLEMTFVTPPYSLDFAACTLDQPPSGFDPCDPQ